MFAFCLLTFALLCLVSYFDRRDHPAPVRNERGEASKDDVEYDVEVFAAAPVEYRGERHEDGDKPCREHREPRLSFRHPGDDQRETAQELAYRDEDEQVWWEVTDPPRARL